jgi:hypothetical protein
MEEDYSSDSSSTDDDDDDDDDDVVAAVLASTVAAAVVAGSMLAVVETMLAATTTTNRISTNKTTTTTTTKTHSGKRILCASDHPTARAIKKRRILDHTRALHINNNNDSINRDYCLNPSRPLLQCDATTKKSNMKEFLRLPIKQDWKDRNMLLLPPARDNAHDEINIAAQLAVSNEIMKKKNRLKSRQIKINNLWKKLYFYDIKGNEQKVNELMKQIEAWEQQLEEEEEEEDFCFKKKVCIEQFNNPT